MEQPNLSYIDELAAGDQDFKAKIIAVIKQELPLEIQEYYSFFQKNEHQSVAQCVHKLKHKISILGLEKNYYLANDFETNLKNNSTVLKNEFEDLLNLIQDYVNNL